MRSKKNPQSVTTEGFPIGIETMRFLKSDSYHLLLKHMNSKAKTTFAKTDRRLSF
jgi:hypothetical protein